MVEDWVVGYCQELSSLPFSKQKAMKIILISFLFLLDLLQGLNTTRFLALDVWVEGKWCWAQVMISEEATYAELISKESFNTIRPLYLGKSSVAKTADLKFYQIKTGFYQLEALENGHYKIREVRVKKIDPNYLILD